MSVPSQGLAHDCVYVHGSTLSRLIPPSSSNASSYGTMQQQREVLQEIPTASLKGSPHVPQARAKGKHRKHLLRKNVDAAHCHTRTLTLHTKCTPKAEVHCTQHTSCRLQNEAAHVLTCTTAHHLHTCRLHITYHHTCTPNCTHLLWLRIATAHCTPSHLHANCTPNCTHLQAARPASKPGKAPGSTRPLGAALAEPHGPALESRALAGCWC